MALQQVPCLNFRLFLVCLHPHVSRSFSSMLNITSRIALIAFVSVSHCMQRDKP